MNTQLELDGSVPVAPPTVKVTERQRVVLDMMASRGAPVTDDEIGATLHAARGKHIDIERCQWCAHDGKDIARALEHKGLLHRIRGVGWQLTSMRDSHPQPEGERHAGPGTEIPY